MACTFDIAVTDRKERFKYKNQQQTWEWLEDRFSHPVVTTETAEEFAKLSKARREELKDHGGLVPGKLRYGSRKAENVVYLSFGMLDADSVPAGINFPEKVRTAFPNVKWNVHTTHSHTLEHQRYRLAVMYNRNVKPDEVPPLLRKVAYKIGMEYFDPCSFEANRMMFWPSHPSNGVFDFQRNDGEPLNVDVILTEYDDWRDVSQWPTCHTESEAVKHEIKRQEDPHGKKGVVGAFCRAYSIEDVIETIIPDVYEPTGHDDRYTYANGESHGGLVVYDSGKFAYSHHATDPACGKLLNAFDFAAVHLYGDKPEKARFKAMSEYAVELDAVKIQLANEKKAQAGNDFADVPEGTDWTKRLKYMSRSSLLENSVWNEHLILTNDPDFAGFAYNELANQIQIIGKVPWERPDSNPFWRDSDTAQLKAILDIRYLPFSSRNHDVAFTKVADDRRFHPIREYFDGLPPWDDAPRLDTLFVDYLGAEDNPYTRAVTRKTIVAAVARIKRPGTKFDSIPVLVGPQGIGKSTLLSRLGGEWYSDSLSIADMKDKTAAEKAQGNMMLELSEMAGMKKMDVETMKSFASRPDDKFRPSYGHVVENHPRQCIIIGTTNSECGFLRDVTGNRRFWPVKVSGECPKRPWDLTKEDVGLIWAEAIYRHAQGEELFLSGDVAETAVEEQRDAMETDEREGLVREYLDRKLPENWNDKNIYERREFISEPDDPTQPKGTVTRTEVSNVEIWCECFGKAVSELKPVDSYALAAIMVRIDGWERAKDKPRLAYYGRQRIYRRVASAE